MDDFVILVACWASFSPLWSSDSPVGPRQISDTVEAIRRLSADFESAQRSAFDMAREAKTEAERRAANRAMPDRRKYAQRFLELAGKTDDEPTAVDALSCLVVQERKCSSTALAAEIERWLRQVLDEFPSVFVEQDITDNFGLLCGNLGPTAGQILRRIAETHPQAETRWEAECALALEQTEIASLVADLRSLAALPPDSKKCAGPALAAACVFGGEARLNAVDSKALVREIEQRLQRIAGRVNEVKRPGICYFHLIMDSPTFSQYHAGIETLLRRVAEGHSDARFRAGARRSLAIYLAGLADLSRTIQSDRAYWVDRLGEDRVDQIRRLDPDRLVRESKSLAEEISKENQEIGRIPDPKIEELRKGNVCRGGDPDRPHRVFQQLK